VLTNDSPPTPRGPVATVDAGRGSPAGDYDDTRAASGSIPRLSGDIRHLIPKLGLRNYWYPALNARRVGSRKPVRVSMLGEELCFFRGANGDVVAIQDVCPHRGARLSEGDCHYRGTVACPYHGWVYDESGKNVAVLSEGPTSRVCGKPGTEARVYPTRTLKGLVFVWIGEGDPAPIEEDVPEEFFHDDALVIASQVYWRCNWEVALENSMDSHVNYVHRNALVIARAGFMPRGAQGENPIFVGNGFGGDVAESNIMRPNPPYDLYPNGWRWPKTNYRRFWTWLFRPLAERARRHIPPPRSPKWCGGHHLPGMFRAEFAYDLYTRMCVPVEEHLTRVWYYHCLRPTSARQRTWQRFLYAALHRWIIEYNFSRQDERVMLNQRYDSPEKLSATDAEVIQWRRLVVTRHYGGRNAPFEYRNPDGMAPEDVPLSRVSVRYVQEQMKLKVAEPSPGAV
jgi:phenylpropionate dioxygenase-like ring-hydroxylating dioxygenase large terminal subunit